MQTQTLLRLSSFAHIPSIVATSLLSLLSKNLFSLSSLTQSCFTHFHTMPSSVQLSHSLVLSFTKTPIAVKSSISSRYFSTLAGSRSFGACRCVVNDNMGHMTHARSWSSLTSNVGESDRSSEKYVSGDIDEVSCGSVFSEEKPLRLNRRQKGLSSSFEGSLNPDLLTILDVGPRNLRKLVTKWIVKVVEIKKLYKDKGYAGKTVLSWNEASSINGEECF